MKMRTVVKKYLQQHPIKLKSISFYDYPILQTLMNLIYYTDIDTFHNSNLAKG